MPCNSDHMAPTVKERQTKHAAELLVYVFNCLNKKVSPELLGASKHIYGEGVHPENVMSMLCGELRSMSPEKQEQIIYNGRNGMARKLADWWEEHQAEDAKRLLKDREKIIKAKYANHVFVVRRNGDMIEGHGPFVMVDIYKNANDAINYICAQEGVMGYKSELRFIPEVGNDGKTLTEGYWAANDHTVVPTKLK